jgi:sarcosine oxidase subunit beta
MTDQYDAIIIGSGIIGCAVAFELAKKGYKTLNIDKLAAPVTDRPAIPAG